MLLNQERDMRDELGMHYLTQFLNRLPTLVANSKLVHIEQWLDTVCENGFSHRHQLAGRDERTS